MHEKLMQSWSNKTNYYRFISRTNCINIWSSLGKWGIICRCGTNYQFILSPFQLWATCTTCLDYILSNEVDLRAWENMIKGQTSGRRGLFSAYVARWGRNTCSEHKSFSTFNTNIVVIKEKMWEEAPTFCNAVVMSSNQASCLWETLTSSAFGKEVDLQ